MIIKASEALALTLLPTDNAIRNRACELANIHGWIGYSISIGSRYIEISRKTSEYSLMLLKELGFNIEQIYVDGIPRLKVTW